MNCLITNVANGLANFEQCFEHSTKWNCLWNDLKCKAAMCVNLIKDAQFLTCLMLTCVSFIEWTQLPLLANLRWNITVEIYCNKMCLALKWLFACDILSESHMNIVDFFMYVIIDDLCSKLYNYWRKIICSFMEKIVLIFPHHFLNAQSFLIPTHTTKKNGDHLIVIEADNNRWFTTYIKQLFFCIETFCLNNIHIYSSIHFTIYLWSLLWITQRVFFLYGDHWSLSQPHIHSVDSIAS